MTSQNTPRRYIIVGPGALGGIIAGELHKASKDVVLVARGLEYEAIKSNGLVIHTQKGVENHKIAIASGVDKLDLTERDVLIITTKAQDAEPLIRDIAWLPVKTAEGTTVASAVLPLVTLQNGLNTERAALRYFKKVYGATGVFPGSKEKVGEVITFGHPKRGLIWIGEYPKGKNAEIEQIASDLGANEGLGAEAVDNIFEWKAWKLIHNTANVLEPLFSASPNRDVAKKRLAEEYLAVVRAIGIDPREMDDPSNTSLDHAAMQRGEGTVDGCARPGNSTLQSFSRGATVETDYLTGEVVLLGRLHGVPTPLNEKFQQLMHQAVAEGRSPGSFPDSLLASWLAEVGTA